MLGARQGTGRDGDSAVLLLRGSPGKDGASSGSQAASRVKGALSQPFTRLSWGQRCRCPAPTASLCSLGRPPPCRCLSLPTCKAAS